MSIDQKAFPTLITGVIGEDVHITGIRLLEHALRSIGFKVVSLGIHNFDDDFVNAAKETDARAILISSLAGHAKMLVGELRGKCREAGLEGMVLYLGGQLVVEEQKWPDTEKMFLDMGFNRVYPPFTVPGPIIDDLARDLGLEGDRT
jgi:methylaspartate mutase sigma subunit